MTGRKIHSRGAVIAMRLLEEWTLQRNWLSRFLTRSFFAGEATNGDGYNGTVHGAICHRIARSERAASVVVKTHSAETGAANLA